MKTVYKYPLQIQDEQKVGMPEGSKILAVQSQRGIPTLWALVDTARLPTYRKITMLGTGHPIHPLFDGRHIGTVQLVRGAVDLVLHFFEPREP